MKRPRKAAVLLGLLAVTGLAIWSGCGSLSDGWEDHPGPPRVLVSFPPLYSFVKNVGGDQVGVMCLCTDLGPHEYQFNPNDTIKLKRADLFLANGLTLDDQFTDKMAKSSSNSKLRYHKLGEKLPALRPTEEGDHKHDDQGHQHGAFDPHVWLGIPQAISMVERIRDDLKEVDTAHADLYERNAAAYIDRLKKLHQDGRKALKGLKNVPVISFHESMGYFADSFGLKMIGAIELRPGITPADRDILELIEKCQKLSKQEKQLLLIAVEPQYPEAAAKLVRDQLEKADVKKVVLVTLDPLETCAANDLDAEWYVRMMTKNLESLKNAK